MEGTMKINDEITVGPQPDSQEIYEFGQEGFKTIVNFRAAHEQDQPISPQAEDQVVHDAGMEYLHIPMSMNSLNDAQIDQFREKYAALPKPIYAHCKSGKRAGAAVMMNLAVEQGKTGEQTLQKAKEIGFECNKPELKEFVRDYVDSHNGSNQ
ncbi:MAG: protein tyrosine phosphatase family protein [Planctomycetaceae bacterium]|nr:protein tyrosine phosphatase family protein [Planctomycetaceae bacterium]MCA9021962.1 protein tyrosine phosphatase family protein [Planctomycetaceae bacterium]